MRGGCCARRSACERSLARATSHAPQQATIAGPSKKIGAKTKASFVVAECGSRSSGVKEPGSGKEHCHGCGEHCKVIETTIRSLDLSNAVAITSRLSVDGMQFRAFVWHVVEHWFVAEAHTDVAQLNNVPRRGRRRCDSEQRVSSAEMRFAKLVCLSPFGERMHYELSISFHERVTSR